RHGIAQRFQMNPLGGGLSVNRGSLVAIYIAKAAEGGMVPLTAVGRGGASGTAVSNSVPTNHDAISSRKGSRSTTWWARCFVSGPYTSKACGSPNRATTCNG